MAAYGVHVKAPHASGQAPLPALSVGDGVFPMRGGKTGILIRPVQESIDNRRRARILAKQVAFEAQRLGTRVVAENVHGVMKDEDLTVDQIQLAVVGDEPRPPGPGARARQFNQCLSNARAWQTKDENEKGETTQPPDDHVLPADAG